MQETVAMTRSRYWFVGKALVQSAYNANAKWEVSYLNVKDNVHTGYHILGFKVLHQINPGLCF